MYQTTLLTAFLQMPHERQLPTLQYSSQFQGMLTPSPGEHALLSALNLTP
jgi:hypothetical protein